MEIICGSLICGRQLQERARRGARHPFLAVRGARTAADGPENTQCVCNQPDGSSRHKESWSQGQNNTLRERSLFLFQMRTRNSQMESIVTRAPFWNN